MQLQILDCLGGELTRLVVYDRSRSVGQERGRIWEIGGGERPYRLARRRVITIDLGSTPKPLSETVALNDGLLRESSDVGVNVDTSRQGYAVGFDPSRLKSGRIQIFGDSMTPTEFGNAEFCPAD